MDFSKSLLAADLIRNNGIDGANEAALLVGMHAALTMLFTHLECTHEEKSRLIHEIGFNNMVDFDPLGARGLIYEENKGLVEAFEIQNGKCIDVPVKGLHVSMWMQGCGELVHLFAGNSPYSNVKQICIRERKKKLIELYGTDSALARESFEGFD